MNLQGEGATQTQTQKSKLTVAPVTPGYNLKKEFLPCKYERFDQSLDNYIGKLKENGAVINQCVHPAIFKLKNGLEYPGIMTDKTLAGPEVLAKIPKKLLLNTRVAMLQPSLHEVWKEPFYHTSTNWEDRVLATYLLLIYSKKQGIWYEMMKHMSKDIDILCFWPEEDIKLLKDKAVQKACRKNLKDFDEEWQQFSYVMKKHKVIPQQYITRDNYKWLYIHLVSRCFGRYLQCITMVPFCEFFNHHISDVLYDFHFQPDNPFKNEQSKYPDPCNFKTQQQRAAVSSSDGSYDSDDYNAQGEFDYTNIQVHKIKWGTKVSDKIQEKDRKAVEKAWSDLNFWLLENLDWRDWTVLYIAQVFEKVNILKNQYLAGRVQAVDSLKEIASLKSECVSYRMQTCRFYTDMKGEGYKYTVNNYSTRKDSEDSFEIKEFPVLNQDKFDYFLLRLNRRDYFEQGNQVYFCYGRLSNRMLLERYGIALEGNKFDHVWIRLDLLRFLLGYPDMLEIMQLRSLSLKRKFKIKRRELCLELIQFIRTTKWNSVRHKLDELYYPFDLDKEYAVLESVKDILKKEASLYDEQVVLNSKLYDPSISYHQYFAIVYQLEHLRIFNLHIRLMQIAQSIIKKLKEGVPFQIATKPGPGEGQNFWYLRIYLDRLQHYKK